MALEPYRSPAEAPPEAREEKVDDATRLGLLRSVHRPPPPWRQLGTAGLAFLPAALVAANAGTVTILPIMGSAAVIFAFLAWGALGKRGLRVEVHAHGLVVVTRRSRNLVVFEDVDAVWYELNTNTVAGRKVARI